MKKKFGNIGKGDYLYYVIKDNYSGLRIYVYRVIEHTDRTVDLGFGRTKKEVTLKYYPWRYMDDDGPRYNWFRDESRVETKIFQAQDDVYDEKGGLWYASLDPILERFKYHIEYIERDLGKIRKLSKFYSKFKHTTKQDTPDKWKTRDYIGAMIVPGKINPELVTWKGMISLLDEGKITIQTLEKMLDWNACFTTCFRKFDYDPYTGDKIQWGRISADLKKITGRDNRI